jgi:hypothetical protein
MAALAKARAMIDAYEISDHELQLTRDETAVLRREPPGSSDPHKIKFYMASAVGKFTDCKVWRDGEKRLVFCGLPSDARFATWLLDSLAAFVRAELVRHLMNDVSVGGDRRIVCNSFAAGCTSRISARLNELCAQPATNANSRALIIVKSQAVSAKMAELGIKLRSSRSSSSRIDGNAYAAGKAAGDRASFGRPVSGNNATLRLS